MNIKTLQCEINEFVQEREWGRFHTPKNLVMALSGEVGELTEIFQWLDDEQSRNLDSETKQCAAHELADVFIYLLRLFDVLEIEPLSAVEEKLKINAENYPVILAKGNATKYDKREV